MARQISAPSISTRTARLKLPIRKKAVFVSVSRGIALGYRRCKGPGRWTVRCADGAGGNWEKTFGTADDYEAADGAHILDYAQALTEALAQARGTDADAGRPATVAEALDAYEASLKARDGDPGNATRVRGHLTRALLAKPVAMLGARELQHWRDSLIAGRTRAAVNRVLKVTKAALNLAAAHDPQRISNRNVWRVGLALLPDAHNPRNAVLPDASVLALVEAAWALDPAVGLLVETLAITGARVSQLARLTIGDLQPTRADPRLMMPSSRKGRRKRIVRSPVPIPEGLAAKLLNAAGKRPATDPLLLKADGTAWHQTRVDDHLEPFAEAAAKAGLAGTTAYALRHSAIVRSLIAGVPIRVVAANVDSSTVEIERTYSKYINDHADAVARRALLDFKPSPSDDNVVPLVGRRS
jgi:integrase